MIKLYILGILSGLCFGIWPLFMNRSGLSGFQTAAAVCVFCALSTLPLGLTGGMPDPSKLSWGFLIAGILTNMAAMILFTNMISSASPAVIGKPLVVMVLFQLIVPSIYALMTDAGGLQAKTACGLACAALAVVLLA